MMVLEKRLYHLRKEKGISQEALARILGVTRQTVSRWECGTSRPTTENLISLSKLYGVDMEFLTDGGAELQTPKETRFEVNPTTISKFDFRNVGRYAVCVVCTLAVCAAICIPIFFSISRSQTKGVDTIPIQELQSDTVTTVDGYFELGRW